MPALSLITGPPAALDAALAEEVHAHKAEHPLAAITILVGGSLLRPFLRARLATLLDGHINVRIVTPAELALRLGEPTLIADDRSPITPLADRAVAQELARAATSYFEPVKETPGFANALHRLFGELRAAAIEPDQLVTASAGSAAEPKLAELADLPGVASADRRGEAIVLRCSDSDRAARAMLERYPAARDVEIAGAGLEDAFLELTGSGDEASTGGA